jgi:hypothetical protein
MKIMTCSTVPDGRLPTNQKIEGNEEENGYLFSCTIKC